MSSSDYQIFQDYLAAFATGPTEHVASAVEDFFADDAQINVVHPFNLLEGGRAYFERFIKPLMASFSGLYRRDYVAMSGQKDGEDWVSSTGYYVGNFVADWLGIRATNQMTYLRVGEFHRMVGGKVQESYIFLDIPELMIAAGQWPDLPSPAEVKGHTGFLPGPATQDGLQGEERDVEATAMSLQMVEDMLLGLATPDEAWRPYWHENMVWYGPAAFGSYLGVENFRAFQVPFEQTFEYWVGGTKPGSETRHFTRFAQNNYVCSGGWPSLNAKQAKPYLGQPSTGKVLYMRVSDWWRRDGDKLIENWVFVDIPHVLLQMGYDVFDHLPGRR